ncbi:MAG: glycosyltransferase [Salibacteraceae bacterium]
MQLNNNIRTFYFAPFDILRSRTNQISDIRFCEGLVQNGCDLTLIAPYVYRKDNLSKNKVLDFYGVENKFKVRFLPTLFFNDVNGTINLLTIIILNSFLFLSLLISAVVSNKKLLIISRSPSILFPFLVLRKLFKKKVKVVTWIHEIKTNKSHTYVYEKSDFLWGTNSAITNDLESKFGFPKSKIGITNNPITKSQANCYISKSDAREKVSINKSPLIVYTGKLFVGQLEAEYILNAAKLTPNYTYLLTGGKPNVLTYYKNWCSENNVSNVLFTGYLKDYNDLKYYQFSADVLVSYYTTKEHDVRYNFPQKIVEYMVTGNPIVTPNFEATQDVLNEQTAIFVEPENVKSLIEGIKKAVENRPLSESIGTTARNKAKNYTFKELLQPLLARIIDSF